MKNTNKLTLSALIISLFFVLTLISNTFPIFSIFSELSVGIFLIIIFFNTDLKYTALSSMSFIFITFIINNSIFSVMEIISSLLIGFVCIFLLKNTNNYIQYDVFVGCFFINIIILFFDYITFLLVRVSLVLDIVNNTKFLNSTILSKIITSCVILIFSYSIFYVIYATAVFLCYRLKLNPIFKHKYNMIFSKDKNNERFIISYKLYILLIFIILFTLCLNYFVGIKYIFIEIFLILSRLSCYLFILNNIIYKRENEI